jgi:5'-nucleotidase
LRILLTNDDGIHAEGLAALERIAAKLSDDVWVCAPEYEQSGASRALTLAEPIRVRRVAERKFATTGTPTDCVMLGVHELVEGGKPDLVLSGVNRGRNAAEDVTYSGTVAGAIEGTVLGIPSFALSQAYAAATRKDPHWATALTFAPDLIRRVLADGMPRDVFVNINFPDCPPEGVRGVAVTSQGKRDQELLRIEPRYDGRGNPYYWIAFERNRPPASRNGTDLSALADNQIAVTPLRLDMTDEPFMTRLAEILG